MTKPTLSIFTGGKTLGVLYREQSEIISKFTEINMPLTSSTGRLGFNLLGKTRIIIVQGVHDGTGFDGGTAEARLGDFIYEMETWVNSAIQTSKVYTDSFGTSYNVHCADWLWTRVNSDPGRIVYTLTFKEV